MDLGIVCAIALMVVRATDALTQCHWRLAERPRGPEHGALVRLDTVHKCIEIAEVAGHSHVSAAENAGLIEIVSLQQRERRQIEDQIPSTETECVHHAAQA